MQQQPEQQQPPPDDKQPRGFLGVRSLGRKLKAAASKVSTFNGNAANYTSNALGLSFGVRKADKTRLRKRRGSSVSTVGLKQASPGEHVYTAENLRRKVLILMSDTGGGHRASAQALQAAFDMEYPGCIEVDIVDIWTEHGPWPFNQFVSSYAYMARNPPVWRLFWEYGRFPLTRRFTEITSNMRCHNSFGRAIAAAKPDMIISVHPLCQYVPLKVLNRMEGGTRVTPFVTVVTDLGGAHPTWFHPGVDRCFVPSEVLRRDALSKGLRPDQIKLHGLPTRPGFWQPVKTDKASLQASLGLQPGVKTCLVVGGGDGVGGLKAIASTLIDELGQADGCQQVVVVCGKNTAVKNMLEKRAKPSNVAVKILGFVTNMDEWMGAVDVIITKAGPGTIAEATIRGLPIMLSAYLPGQEEGNIPYVVEGGYGSFSKNPKVIAETVREWLTDEDKLAAMAAAAKLAARPQATTAIARDIGKMIYAPYSPPQFEEVKRVQDSLKQMAPAVPLDTEIDDSPEDSDSESDETDSDGNVQQGEQTKTEPAASSSS